MKLPNMLTPARLSTITAMVIAGTVAVVLASNDQYREAGAIATSMLILAGNLAKD